MKEASEIAVSNDGRVDSNDWLSYFISQNSSRLEVRLHPDDIHGSGKEVFEQVIVQLLKNSYCNALAVGDGMIQHSHAEQSVSEFFGKETRHSQRHSFLRNVVASLTANFVTNIIGRLIPIVIVLIAMMFLPNIELDRINLFAIVAVLLGSLGSQGVDTAD